MSVTDNFGLFSTFDGFIGGDSHSFSSLNLFKCILTDATRRERVLYRLRAPHSRGGYAQRRH